MEMTLTPAQRAFLQAEPVPLGHPNKLRLALRLVGGNIETLAAEMKVPGQQLGRYVAGKDLRLSTAQKIAAALGCSVNDLWPMPPAKRKRATATISKPTTKRKAA